MKRTLVSILLLLACPACVYAQYGNLYIQHPQQTWRAGTGTIEEAVLVVQPKGVFMQHELYLTFSARGLSFSSWDSVEVQLYFDLPKDAFVADLWLWVGNDIMSALILDRSTASSIYEGIVKRRRDPALLTKSYGNSYTLKVYPLAGTGTRKVKLTYLQPTEWTLTSVSSRLPAWIVRSSRYLPSFLRILYRSSALWSSPRIVESPSLQFKATVDTTYGETLACDVPSSLFQSGSNLNLAVNAPLQNGVYVGRSGLESEGVYQLAIVPSAVLNLNTEKKVLFLFDYDAVKTSTSKSDILTSVQHLLRNHFTVRDSFGMVFTRTQIVRASEHWIQADSAGVSAAFAASGPEPIGDASDLAGLLTNGIEFVRQNGGEGNIVLIAGSDRLGDYRFANPVVNSLTQLLTPKMSVHVVDLVNKNYNWYYLNGKYYYGNDYFYENLARIGNGTTQTLRTGGQLSTFLSTVIQTLRGHIESFDLYTKLGAGFCYGRFSIGVAPFESVPTDRVLFQVGKFQGTFPFVVELAGFYGGTGTQRQIVVQEPTIETSDSMFAKVWTSSYITSLEALPSSSATNRTIVDLSLQHRILTRITAFLALEPNDTVKAITPTSGTGVSGVKDEQPLIPRDSLLQAYPNPFNMRTNILVRLPKGATWHDATMKIYNTLGQIVCTFDPTKLSDSRHQVLVWGGQSDAGGAVSSGVYYFVLTTGKSRHALKLMVMK